MGSDDMHASLPGWIRFVIFAKNIIGPLLLAISLLLDG
jgi:hypothetical protein